MTRYTSSFLKSTSITLASLSIPTIFFLEKNVPSLRLSSILQNQSKNTIKLNLEEGVMEILGEKVDTEELMNSNEYCPQDTNDERRNVIHCSLLKEIMDILGNEIGNNIETRLHLEHPEQTNSRILLSNVLKDPNREIFRYYFLSRPEVDNLSHMWYLHKQVTPRKGEDWSHMNQHVHLQLPEIRKHFPNIKAGEFHRWKYMAILKRLSQMEGDIVLKPLKLFHYYHYFRDPYRIALMDERAQYFYYNTGSKWSGWKNREYILGFTEALDTYLPTKK